MKRLDAVHTGVRNLSGVEFHQPLMLHGAARAVGDLSKADARLSRPCQELLRGRE